MHFSSKARGMVYLILFVGSLALARVLDGTGEPLRILDREQKSEEKEQTNPPKDNAENSNECAYCQSFDPNNKVVIIGRIVSVSTFMPMRGMEKGILMKVQTETETVPIHMGPSWYVFSQKVKLRPNDLVTIRGVRIEWNDAPAVIANEVEKEGGTINMKDSGGHHLWSNRRKVMRDFQKF